jgi:hypothetical protein
MARRLHHLQCRFTPTFPSQTSSTVPGAIANPSVPCPPTHDCIAIHPWNNLSPCGNPLGSTDNTMKLDSALSTVVAEELHHLLGALPKIPRLPAQCSGLHETSLGAPCQLTTVSPFTSIRGDNLSHVVSTFRVAQTIQNWNSAICCYVEELHHRPRYRF